MLPDLSVSMSVSAAPILRSESEVAYNEFVADFIRAFPANPGLAEELAGLSWRLRRIPRFETCLLSLEIRRLAADPELAGTIEDLEPRHLEALAFLRLVENKVLTNLYHQEARLERRASKIRKELIEGRNQTVETPAAIENRKNEPNPAPAPTPAFTAPAPVRSQKVGRNEPCPCGSGLKHKRCCGNPVPHTTAAAA